MSMHSAGRPFDSGNGSPAVHFPSRSNAVCQINLTECKDITFIGKDNISFLIFACRIYKSSKGAEVNREVWGF